MLRFHVQQNRQHRCGCGRVRGKPPLEGSGDFLFQGILPKALTGKVRTATRMPRSREAGKSGKVEGLRLVEQVALPGFLRFPKKGQGLTNKSLFVQIVFSRA